MKNTKANGIEVFENANDVCCSRSRKYHIDSEADLDWYFFLIVRTLELMIKAEGTKGVTRRRSEERPEGHVGLSNSETRHLFLMTLETSSLGKATSRNF